MRSGHCGRGHSHRSSCWEHSVCGTRSITYWCLQTLRVSWKQNIEGMVIESHKNYGYCNFFCSIRSPFYCLSLPCREKRLFICRTDSFRILWHFSKAFFSKFDKHIWRCTVIKIRSPSLSLSDWHPWKIIKNREISHDSTRPTSAGFLCRVRFGYAAWSGLTRWHVTMLNFEKTSHRDDIFYSIHSLIVHAASTYWLWENIEDYAKLNEFKIIVAIMYKLKREIYLWSIIYS